MYLLSGRRIIQEYKEMLGKLQRRTLLRVTRKYQTVAGWAPRVTTEALILFLLAEKKMQFFYSQTGYLAIIPGKAEPKDENIKYSCNILETVFFAWWE